MNRFEDKVVVVTGGNSGIGLAAATAFAREGAQVIITGRDPATLDVAEKTIGAGAKAMRSDASNVDEIRTLARDVASSAGRVDSVFVNAGFAAPAPLEAVDESAFDALFDVHAKGPYFLIQQLAPLMPKGGTIVVNGSILAHMGMPGMAVYGAAKAGLISLIRNLSAELLPKGIRLNAVSAGPVATPGMDRAGLPEEARAHLISQIISQIPLGRIADPEEIATSVLFLASSDSSFVVGHDLIIDGGMSTL
jgi:NAD(P)-dependent dehydrogenase (short-subunit alcohol dehydrogenase family)